MQEKIDYYRKEWAYAQKEGNETQAAVFKERYRRLVIESLKKPYNQYFEPLKAYPMIYLN